MEVWNNTRTEFSFLGELTL